MLLPTLIYGKETKETLDSQNQYSVSSLLSFLLFSKNPLKEK
jgi:hypothetical protein